MDNSRQKPREGLVHPNSFNSIDDTYAQKHCVHVIEKSAYDKAVEALKLYSKQLPEVGSRMTPEIIELMNDGGKKLEQTLKELGELND